MQPLHATPSAIIAALRAGNLTAARTSLASLAKARPHDPNTWLSRAHVALADGRLEDSSEATKRAERLGAPRGHCSLLRANIAKARGDADEAIEFAQRASREGEPLEGSAVHCEVLLARGRLEEVEGVLARTPELDRDGRGLLLRGRILRRQRQAREAERTLRDAYAAAASSWSRRMAGFELVKLLDAERRYGEAFDAAVEVHATTGAPFDTPGLIADVRKCHAFAERGAFRLVRGASRPVERTVLFCCMPRSGSTLLEQMLDCHPQARGLGELAAMTTLTQALIGFGGWPEGAIQAPPADLDRLQSEYLASSRGSVAMPADQCAVDKSLMTWMQLPAIRAALPGAKLIRLRRDVRDNAISIFLADMHPIAMGWTSSLDQIRRVIEVGRRCVPTLLRTMELDALEMRYEALVSDPRAELARLLHFLDLPWDDACLSPEANPRTVLTISREQVTRPINRASVGRWKNYADRFDASWDELDAIDAEVDRRSGA